MEFTLNGRPVSVRPAPGASLLEVLRGELGLRSMKDGCAPEGSCGACTVIVDGRAVVSCAQPATPGRRQVGRHASRGCRRRRRERGPTASPRPAPSQCGFCSPGIVMKAEALLGARSGPVPRGDRPGARREPVPLHRLRGDPRRHRAGGRGPRAAGRRRRSTGPAASARARSATRPAELALGEQAVRGRPAGPRDAPRRAPLLGPSARRRPPDRHVARRRTPGRRRGRDVSRRARQAPPGPDRRRLAAARGRGRDDALRRRRAGRRRGRDQAGRPRGRRARRGRLRGARPDHRPVRGAGGRRPAAPRGRQPPVESRSCARGDVDAALAGAAHVATETFRTAADRARLPRAGGVPRRPVRRVGRRGRHRQPRSTSLPGPGRLGGPPPGRLVPGPARERTCG